MNRFQTIITSLAALLAAAALSSCAPKQDAPMSPTPSAKSESLLISYTKCHSALSDGVSPFVPMPSVTPSALATASRTESTMILPRSVSL